MPALHLVQRPQELPKVELLKVELLKVELPKDTDFERRETRITALNDGQIHVKVALRRVYTGKNFGKQLVKL